MSDADSFIQEVTDEVRRDRMFRLWRRYGPFVIGGIVALVAATAISAWLESRAEADARAAGAALLEAAAAEDPAARLLAAADALEDGAAALARLRAAGALAAQGDALEAARLYEAIAAGAEAPQPLAELAALRAATLRAEAGEAGPEAFDPLIREDGAFRAPALEARGARKLALGDAAGARADFEAALVDPRATEATRLRVGELLAAAGGGE